MGCVASRSSNLETLTGEAMRLREDVSTSSTKIYVSTSGRVWKVCHGSSHVMRHTFLNNYRVKSMAKCKFVVCPEKLIKVNDTTVAIGMKHVSTDLYNFVRKPFDLQRTWRGLCDVAKAITWMHSQGLAHRDIKPENIVLDIEHFYLIDFDFSSPLEKYVRCGTANYVASRQMITAWKCTERECSMRNDVYAFGKTVLFVLCAASTFKMVQGPNELFSLYNAEFVPEDSCVTVGDETAADWLNVVTECCNVEPPLRITLPGGISTTYTHTTRDGATCAAHQEVFCADDVVA